MVKKKSHPVDSKFIESVQGAFEQKLNYNCPLDEKTGEGPGSCGGAVKGEGGSGPKKSWREKLGFGKKQEEYSMRDNKESYYSGSGKIKRLKMEDLQQMNNDEMNEHVAMHIDAIKKVKEELDRDGFVTSEMFTRLKDNQDSLETELSRRANPQKGRGTYKAGRRY